MDVVDARINLDGEIMISKEAPVSQRTIPIDLQWMVMACDPESVERETCDELPVKQIILLEISNATAVFLKPKPKIC